MNSIFILDQNYLRLAEFDEIINRPNVKIIIPEVAYYEMCKISNWESTIKASLRILSKHPHKVFTTYSNEEIDIIENTSFKPIKNIISKEHTKFTRQLLLEINKISPETLVAHMRTVLTDDVLKKTSSFNTASKASLLKLINELKNQIGADYFLGLRNKKISDIDFLTTLRTQLPKSVRSHYLKMGVSKEKADSIMRRNPLFIRRAFLYVIIASDWIVKNGFNNVAEEKIANQFADNEYIISATYFHGEILSREKSMHLLFNRLKYVLKQVNC